VDASRQRYQRKYGIGAVIDVFRAFEE
jgi:hypothetical protein